MLAAGTDATAEFNAVHSAKVRVYGRSRWAAAAPPADKWLHAWSLRCGSRPSAKALCRVQAKKQLAAFYIGELVSPAGEVQMASGRASSFDDGLPC
jgi:hypothetical protein